MTLATTILAAAEPAPGDAPPARPGVSRDFAVNLINRLVESGALTRSTADELIAQAERDTSRAQAAPSDGASAPQGGEQPHTVRVTYVPEVVKRQLREEIKQEVIATAREERWATPRTFPDWVSSFSPFGDIRMRGEFVYFPDGNDNTGAFPNFNAINTGAPFDVAGSVFSPQLNVDQNRSRMRMRLRLGASIDQGEGFAAGLRLATGDSSSPVSTNQSFGATGGFSKYAIWLDRAFLRYEIGSESEDSASFTFGRLNNPFFSTDMIWDDDLGFDGVVVQGRYRLAEGLRSFGAAGAFPVYNTDFNFSSNRPAKFSSSDKWLYGAQAGVDWTIAPDLSVKLGGAFYQFVGVDGNLSTPFTPLTTQDNGDTDIRRPAFAQKGNTYMALRSIVPGPLNNYGSSLQYQYFGLATGFREVAATMRVDYDRFAPFQVSLTGEWVRNTSFDRVSIEGQAVNNLGDPGDGDYAPFVGGDTGWNVGLRVGHAALEKRWQWNLGLGYRYVESDAVVDGFAESDFGGGGTNVKGYTFSGSLALSRRVAAGFRWMSSNEVSGPTLKQDTLQVDINGKF